ncbi:hypothetical protein [Streptomyces sp. F001]|uniref:hypothetical protein n=1 Tax=Streptomyces sp. F001 TaxID=1510026 RepID=UPI0013EE5C70|nr:hypothetical protein [Streptomyces sp. F001]
MPSSSARPVQPPAVWISSPGSLPSSTTARMSMASTATKRPQSSDLRVTIARRSSIVQVRNPRLRTEIATNSTRRRTSHAVGGGCFTGCV